MGAGGRGDGGRWGLVGDDVDCCPLPIQSYFYNDDTFNFNFAQASAATGNFPEAEETFLLIQSEKTKSDYVYISWLARCCELTWRPQRIPSVLWHCSIPSYNESEAGTCLGTVPQDGDIS